MSAPHEEGAEITAHMVISPLDDNERFGRQLEDVITADLQARQAAFVVRRLRVPAQRAQLIAGLAFPGRCL